MIIGLGWLALASRAFFLHSIEELRMRNFVVFAGLILLAAGCGGGSDVEIKQEVAQSKPGANGGIAFPLPDNKGYAEVVIERGKPGQPVVLAVYLLDDSARLAAPGNITTKIARIQIPGEDAAKQVALSARESSGKKAVGKRFASEPGAYDFDELKGELVVSIDGKESTIPFAFR